MVYQKFIKTLMQKRNLTQEETETIVSQMAKIIIQEVKNGTSVVMPEIGSFELKVKAERKMYNPSTKTYKIIPESKSITFKQHASFKELINQTK